MAREGKLVLLNLEGAVCEVATCQIGGCAAMSREGLKRELARVTEERTILKKATAYFARESQ
ncbi:hypothetical protein ROLI_032910 [Roseobacter fucihabitans]|uniref:Uncharacterized protein n=2 Tax=Roseobacter fucihabitans TaxID=1537242 RepID=A0ABZ2BVY6_9RHOB|nr:hypothetical protein [Roseobacter litoralis]